MRLCTKQGIGQITDWGMLQSAQDTMYKNQNNNQMDDKIKQLSIKLMELGNLVAASLAFGKAFVPKIIDLELLGFGMGIASWLYTIAWFIRPDKRR